MRRDSIQSIIGILLLLSSGMMLPSALVGYLYNDGTSSAFLESAGILALLGILLYLPVRQAQYDLRLRDGFLVVAVSWLTLCIGGSVPFLLMDNLQISVVDAFFEAVSGLTTTGATVITQIDELPRGIQFYRQQSQWFGGMGIIVLAVAVLPMLRIGGMQLFRAETPGPMKDSKLTPRITETAKALWLIYLGLTVTCALAYWLAGMSGFDAISHSFSTVAIGGFSTHDSSMAWFNSPLIESIAMVFMIISGMNFALHFLAWRNATMLPYRQDAEVKVYLLLLLFASIAVSAGLYLTNTFGSVSESVRYGMFQAVSFLTTTGYTTAPGYLWPSTLPVILMMMATIGGCAGSTGGGMKVMRVMMLYRQSVREIHHLIHPNATIPTKMGGKTISGKVMYAVWGFFFLYMASFAILSLLVTITGVDPITAFSAVGASIANLGPAMGEVGDNYASINDAAKVILAFAMLLGRLEIFTLLVLFTPAFWRD